MTKSIEELLKEQNWDSGQTNENTNQESSSSPEGENSTKAQQVEGYSSSDVVALLKVSLNIHWQQAIALTAQAIHLERWGYNKLAKIIKEDAEQEHEHASVNIERLEFFDEDSQPITIIPPVWQRHNIAEMIRYNLESVKAASITERATIMAARNVGDEITANIMIPLLKGSEDGIRLYEGYLKMIEQMGLENFLTLQV